MYATEKPPPWETDALAVSLESAQGITTLGNMIDANEIKMGFITGFRKYLSQIFLTALNGYETRAFCFSPVSHAYQTHFLASYNITGEKVNQCAEEGCYLCISTHQLGLGDLGHNVGNQDIILVDDECGGFDPERPNYPHTCNYSDRFSQFSCTNYCVHDLGCGDWCEYAGICDEGCAPNERKVRKSYYAVGDGFEHCLSHWREVREDYCVGEPYAGCDIRDYPSYQLDFVWGCSNPRRPIEWVVRSGV